MKNLYALIATMVFCLLLGGMSFAASYDDVQLHKACKYCGMSREMYAHSRMLIEYEDGSTVGTCSLHCVAVDLALNIDKAPKAIRVGDYGTRELINAETAVWVIGGTKPGVMSKNAKWAFAGSEDAEKFRKENGGTIAGFDTALEAAYRDINDDTKMIRERRKMKRMKALENKQ
jgi:copper chaperone NosL